MSSTSSGSASAAPTSGANQASNSSTTATAGQKRPAPNDNASNGPPPSGGKTSRHGHGPAAPKRLMFPTMDPAVALTTDSKKLDKPFPYFRKPNIVGSFSIDGERRLKNDRHQMKFLHEKLLRDPKSFTKSYKRVQLDLNLGLENVKRKLESARNEKIDRMLEWILLNKEVFQVQGSPTKSTANDSSSSGGGDDSSAPGDPSSVALETLSTDFVCFRGLLTTLMCTPYERRDGWEFNAVKFKKTIYLCAVETDQKKSQRLNESQRQKDMCSWGFKFEQYVLSDEPRISDPNHDVFSDEYSSEPVNESEEFCCMFRSRLGCHSVVYGAEMDGFRTRAERADEDNRDMLDLNLDGTFVELKTSRVIDNKRLQNTFAEFKTLKWWAQSFLVGVPKVLCGFRDDDGMVVKLEDYPTMLLPKMGKNWLPNVCMNFLNQLLAYVYQLINPSPPTRNSGPDSQSSTNNTDETASENELVMYNFSWDPRNGGGDRIRVVKQRFIAQSVLPSWYTSKVFSPQQ